MKPPATLRRIFGVSLAVLALLALPALAVAGVPVLKMSSVYFADTGQQTTSVKYHWTVFASAAVFFLGLLLAFLPAPERVGDRSP